MGRERRDYRSPLRAQRAAETRTAVLDAARRLFTTSGWSGTGMRDIAAEAGVATETLYAHFPSKRALLQAAADAAVVGDQEAVALADRPEFAAIGKGPRHSRIAAAAHILAGVHERTAGFAKVIRQAAPSDSEIAGILDATRQRQRGDVAAALQLLLGHPLTDAETDGIWALTSPEIYLLLVESSGWTVDQYETWIADTLERVLPRSRTRNGVTR